MKRLFHVFIIFTAVFLSLLSVSLGGDAVVRAQNTDNFTISSYGIAYDLGRDSDNRSTLKTVETITAEFPTFDQNHGLERALHETYNGHSTNLKIESVTNGKGSNLEYSTRSSNGTTILRIGSADSYVHGTQVYEITYTQRDVTNYFENTIRDEWYWDTNGTEWRVPIESLTIRARIDSALVPKQVGTPACYVGMSGSRDTCMFETEGEGVYVTAVQDVSAGENVTVAFGFQPKTFAAYTPSLWEILVIIWGVLQVFSVPIAFILIVIFGLLYTRRHNRLKELQPIPAEYIPPKDASVVVSAQVAGTVMRVFSAQLIDLAVRRYISIIETRPKSTWRVAEYDIVIEKNISELRSEESEIMFDMFGYVPQIGERLALSTLKNNMSYSSRTLDNDQKLKKLIEGQYKLREKVPGASKLFYRWTIVVLIFAILTLSIALLIAAGIIWGFGLTIRPLTDTGLRLRRYVLGLDKYVKASEAERLKFLQGPDTAEKIGYMVDTNNTGELVKLYERTLPYAVIFGREKEWATRLGDYYQQTNTSPTWYSGSSAFNGAVFASTLSSFSQASVYSGGSSSSSGGSSGGGSSGGGGGGGGGGGW